MEAIIAEIKKIPPVTRFLCISLVSVSGVVLMNVLPRYVAYHYAPVFTLQIWRFWSCFFVGSRGLAFIFELIMLYRTGNELEQGPYARKSADLAYQLCIACGAIIVTSIPVKSVLFFHPFLLCIVYLSSQLAPPGAQASLFGLVSIPIKYFPFALLGMDLLNGGPRGAAISVPGIIVGHLWWVSIWGTEIGGRGGRLAAYGRAPRWLAKWFGEHSAPDNAGPGAGRGANSGGGVHVVAPRTRLEETSTTAPTTHAHRWGSGQRLGTD